MTVSTAADSPPATEEVAITATTIKLVIGQVTYEFDPMKPGKFYHLRSQLVRARDIDLGLLKHYQAEDPQNDEDPPTLPGSIQAVSSRIVALNLLIKETTDPSAMMPTHLVIEG